MHNAKRVCLFIPVALALLGVLAWGAGDDFLGTWVNPDPNSFGPTKLIIAKVGSDDYTVEGFASCVPADCEWGIVELHLAGSDIGDDDYRWGLAIWDSLFKSTYLIVHLECNRLVTVTYSVFGPDDGREDFRTLSLLSKS